MNLAISNSKDADINKAYGTFLTEARTLKMYVSNKTDQSCNIDLTNQYSKILPNQLVKDFNQKTGSKIAADPFSKGGSELGKSFDAKVKSNVDTHDNETNQKNASEMCGKCTLI